MKFLDKIKQLYFLSQIPRWYRRFVSNTEIPSKDFLAIKEQIIENKYSKRDIKKLLISIQKTKATKNKLVWDHYLDETLKNRYQNLHLNIDTNSNFSAVIVEARCHPHFKVVTQNIIKNTQHLGVSLIVYHGLDNEKFVKDELKEYENIQFENLNVKNIDIENYNEILLSQAFWKKIKSDKILIYQTDALSFKELDPFFLKFDYIGAPWKKNIRKKNKVAVGNGGLSIRSKSMMLKIIEQNISRPNNMPEDVFLCQIIKKQKYNLATLNEALNFSTENIFNSNAFGCHKIWEETTTDQLKEILK